jgi:hypothetical protein
VQRLPAIVDTALKGAPVVVSGANAVCRYLAGKYMGLSSVAIEDIFDREEQHLAPSVEVVEAAVSALGLSQPLDAAGTYVIDHVIDTGILLLTHFSFSTLFCRHSAYDALMLTHSTSVCGLCVQASRP